MTASVANAGETASAGFTGTVWAQGVSKGGAVGMMLKKIIRIMVMLMTICAMRPALPTR